MLSGAVFNGVGSGFYISNFFNFFVSAVINETHFNLLVEIIVFDVVVGSVSLFGFNFYDVGFQKVINSCTESPVVPDFHDVKIQAHQIF